MTRRYPRAVTVLADTLDHRAPLVRVARVGVVGAVVTGTAALAHVLAGGRVDPVALLLVALGATAVGLVLVPRRITPGQLLGLMLLGQAAVHLGAGSEAGHAVGPMLLAHVSASVVSLWAATRAERWLLELADRLPRVARPAVVPVPAVVGLPVAHVPWTRGGLDPRAEVEGRGPPSLG